MTFYSETVNLKNTDKRIASTSSHITAFPHCPIEPHSSTFSLMSKATADQTGSVDSSFQFKQTSFKNVALL